MAIDRNTADQNTKEAVFIKDDDDISAVLGDDEPENVSEKKYRHPRKRGKKKLVVIISLACILAILLATVIILIVSGSKKEEPVNDNTGTLYFTSDLLSAEGGSFTVFDRIEFDLHNYADELRVSDRTIEEYSVRVMSGTEDITAECRIAKEKASLAAESIVSAGVAVEIPAERMNTPLDVIVASEPENIVLKGSFTVVPSWTWVYSDSSGSVSGRLYIAANKEMTVRASWDPELVTADPTNPYIKADEDETSCTLTLEAGSGAEIYFFKKDVTADYSSAESGAVTVELIEAGPSSDGTDAGRFDDVTSSDVTETAPDEIHDNPEN